MPHETATWRFRCPQHVAVSQYLAVASTCLHIRHSRMPSSIIDGRGQLDGTAVEAEHAQVRPSAWCVGATIHKQALSSEVCSWAGGVGVVADRQRTSSLQPYRRLGDGQAALRHCISLEAEASDAGRGAPRSRAPWPPARSWQVGRRRCVSTLLDLEPVSIE